VVLPEGVTTEIGGEYEFDMETLPPIFSGLGISLVIIFFFVLINFRKFGISIVVMLSMSLCLFGAMVGLWLSDFTIGLTSVLGFITLLGMIVRNVILMYQHAEEKRKYCLWSARLAAYDAGKRRMVPIFLPAGLEGLFEFEPRRGERAVMLNGRGTAFIEAEGLGSRGQDTQQSAAEPQACNLFLRLHHL